MARRRRSLLVRPGPPLSVWLKRRQRRRWMTVAAAMLVLVVLLTFRGLGRPRIEPAWLTRGMLKVEAVSDDLTLTARSADMSDHAAIRLLGVARGAADATAAHWLRVQTAGGVRIEIDSMAGRLQDEDGTWLAYVYDAQGRLLNEMLIQQGLAAMDRQTACRLHGWFDRLERGAKAKERGVWAP